MCCNLGLPKEKAFFGLKSFSRAEKAQVAPGARFATISSRDQHFSTYSEGVCKSFSATYLPGFFQQRIRFNMSLIIAM